MSCEEEVIRTVALDSTIRFLRQQRQVPDAAPRVLATLHLDPFRVARNSAPAAQLDDLAWNYLRRIYPELTLVDSPEKAFRQDGGLTIAGPLFVITPVSWRGDSAAVVRLAYFPSPQIHSGELYVRLEYRAARWSVARIECGWVQ